MTKLKFSCAPSDCLLSNSVVLNCLVFLKWEIELDVKYSCRVVLSASHHEVHSRLDHICSEFLMDLS